MSNNRLLEQVAQKWALKLPLNYINPVIGKFMKIRNILGGTTNVVENIENYLNCDAKINDKKAQMRQLREEITLLEMEKNKLADIDVNELDSRGELKNKIKSLPVNDVHSLAQICNIGRIQAQLDQERTAEQRAANSYRTYL